MVGVQLNIPVVEIMVEPVAVIALANVTGYPSGLITDRLKVNGLLVYAFWSPGDTRTIGLTTLFTVILIVSLFDNPSPVAMNVTEYTPEQFARQFHR